MVVTSALLPRRSSCVKVFGGLVSVDRSWSQAGKMAPKDRLGPTTTPSEYGEKNTKTNVKMSQPPKVWSITMPKKVPPYCVLCFSTRQSYW
jgi:hypothetical protein